MLINSSPFPANMPVIDALPTRHHNAGGGRHGVPRIPLLHDVSGGGMRIASRKAPRFSALLVLMAMLCTPLVRAAPDGKAPDTPEFTVKRLYRDYAWQAIGGKQAFGNEAINLRDRSLLELKQYFEPGLADLIAKTRECAVKKSLVCSRGFDLIFDAHGSGVDDLDTLPMNKSNVVGVKFRNPLEDRNLRLDYKMVQTAGGWRIADIRYANHKINLRDSLTAALEQSNSVPRDQAAPEEKASETPEATVKRLYRDYAWEALGGLRFERGLVSLQEQTLIELDNYFESGLSRLIRADRDCVERTGEICSLDSSIIFDSSDPYAADLHISLANKHNQVLVTFKFLANQELIRLRYDMVKTPSGWRIYDIRYLTSKYSLRGGLRP